MFIKKIVVDDKHTDIYNISYIIYYISYIDRESTDYWRLRLRLGQTVGDLLPLWSKTGKVGTSSF